MEVLERAGQSLDTEREKDEVEEKE